MIEQYKARIIKIRIKNQKEFPLSCYFLSPLIVKVGLSKPSYIHLLFLRVRYLKPGNLSLVKC